MLITIINSVKKKGNVSRETFPHPLLSQRLLSWHSCLPWILFRNPFHLFYYHQRSGSICTRQHEFIYKFQFSPQYSNRLAGRLQLIFYLAGFIRNKETANLHKGHTILRQRSQICHSPGHAQIIHFPVLFLPSYILSSPMNKFHVL